MAVLAWVMMAIAIWHFTVFLPDRFWAGIVGAFVGAVVGAVVVGLLLHGGSVPARDDTDILVALEGVPGSLLGLAAVYAIGLRQSRAEGEPA